MKTRKFIRRSALLLSCGCLVGLGLVLAQAEPPKTDSTAPSTNSVPPKAESAPKTKKPAAQDPALTGAELYSINCERCHQERYPTERTGAQWKTIMLHMQVRANIPPSQARLILEFLQENSGR